MSEPAAEEGAAASAGAGTPPPAEQQEQQQQQQEQLSPNEQQQQQAVAVASTPPASTADAAAAGQQPPPSPPPRPPPNPEHLAHAAGLVRHVRAAVQELADDVMRSKAYREEFTNALAAAFSATVALQESVSAVSGAEGVATAVPPLPLVLRAGADVRVAIGLVHGLVQQHGRPGWFTWSTRDPAVLAKIEGQRDALKSLEDTLWRQIDPDNTLHRELRASRSARRDLTATLSEGGAAGGGSGDAAAAGSGGGSGGGAASPLVGGSGGAGREEGGGATIAGGGREMALLRRPNKHKVTHLVWFPAADGSGSGGGPAGGNSGSGGGAAGDGGEGSGLGCVAWAAHHNLKVIDLGSDVAMLIPSAAEGLTATAAGQTLIGGGGEALLWTGHEDGSLKAWLVAAAEPAAPAVYIADAAVTALAVDPLTGAVWAGTDDGHLIVAKWEPPAADDGPDDDAGSFHSSRAGVTALGRIGIVGTPCMPEESPFLDELSPRTSLAGSVVSGGYVSIASGSYRSISGGGGSGKGLGRRRASRPRMAPDDEARARAAASTLPPPPHGGAVTTIAFLPRSGRAVTAGGFAPGRPSAGGGSGLMTWDTSTFEFQGAASRRTTQWLRSPVVSAAAISWPRLGFSAPAAGGGSAGGAPPLPHSASTGGLSVPSGSGTVIPEEHLVTGHDNGQVLMWDAAGGAPAPVLVLTRGRGAVRAVGVLEALGLLASAHSSGKITLQRLDPKIRVPPRGDANVGLWQPRALSIAAHRIGLTAATTGPSSLVSAGASGSVKLTAEPALRAFADAAGVRLPPPGQLPVALAPGMSLPSPQQQTAAAGAAAATGLGQRGEQSVGAATARSIGWQGPGAFISPVNAAVAAAAAAAAGGAAGGQHSQLERFGSEGAVATAAVWAAAARAPLSEDSPWVIPFDTLRLGRVVGEGSYGHVCIAWWNETEVAVKIFHASRGAAAQSTVASGGYGGEARWDESRLRALSKEADILANLRHPNVVMFLGVCLQPPCVVTEFCAMGSLYDVLRKARQDTAFASRLTWPRRLLMALDAAKGMLYLHSHRPTVLHRDLKSCNLMVSKDWRVQVGDFNLSRYMSRDAAFIKSSLENNPRWSAPEVVVEGRFSKEADVYSFGVVLWELLTWQEPWAGANAFQIMVALQDGRRPAVPKPEEVPGALGAPPAAVADYARLLQECWDSIPAARPSFEEIIPRLKAILLHGRQQPPLPSAGSGGTGGMQLTSTGSEEAVLRYLASASAGGGAPQQQQQQQQAAAVSAPPPVPTPSPQPPGSPRLSLPQQPQGAVAAASTWHASAAGAAAAAGTAAAPGSGVASPQFPLSPTSSAGGGLGGGPRHRRAASEAEALDALRGPVANVEEEIADMLALGIELGPVGPLGAGLVGGGGGSGGPTLGAAVLPSPRPARRQLSPVASIGPPPSAAAAAPAAAAAASGGHLRQAPPPLVSPWQSASDAASSDGRDGGFAAAARAAVAAAGLEFGAGGTGSGGVAVRETSMFHAVSCGGSEPSEGADSEAEERNANGSGGITRGITGAGGGLDDDEGSAGPDTPNASLLAASSTSAASLEEGAAGGGGRGSGGFGGAAAAAGPLPPAHGGRGGGRRERRAAVAAAAAAAKERGGGAMVAAAAVDGAAGNEVFMRGENLLASAVLHTCSLFLAHSCLSPKGPWTLFAGGTKLSDFLWLMYVTLLPGYGSSVCRSGVFPLILQSDTCHAHNPSSA